MYEILAGRVHVPACRSALGALFLSLLVCGTSQDVMSDDNGLTIALGTALVGTARAEEGSRGPRPMLVFPFKVRQDGPYLASELACDTPTPEPIDGLDVTSIYTPGDETHSKVDPKAQEIYLEKMRKVREFASDLVRMANKFHEEGDLASAACGLTWLEDWARADALAELQTRQAYLTSTRIYSGLALGMMQLMPAAEQMGTDIQVIQDWFTRRAEPLVNEVFGDPMRRASNRQNHRYWGGLAIASIGVVTGRRDFLDWGVESYRIGVCQIEEDGTLPLELARGKRARQYHNHALAPLILIAEIAEANDVAAYDFCDSSIHRLVEFMMTSVFDESQIEKLTGHKQMPIPTRPGGYFRGDRFAWAEPYRARFPDKAAEYKIGELKLRRPLYSTNLGGTTTSLFAH